MKKLRLKNEDTKPPIMLVACDLCSRKVRIVWRVKVWAGAFKNPVTTLRDMEQLFCVKCMKKAEKLGAEIVRGRCTVLEFNTELRVCLN